MSRQGNWQALQRLIRLHESRSPEDVPIRAAIARHMHSPMPLPSSSATRPTKPMPSSPHRNHGPLTRQAP